MTVWQGNATFGGAGGLSIGSSALRPLQPDADISDGLWTDQGGGTSLFAQIDEIIASDAEYIKSGANPTSDDICKISLSNPTGIVTQPFIVSYRYRKSDTGGINLRVRLLEGTTERGNWFHSNPSTTFVTAEQALSSAQFSAITDFNNLFLEFTASLFNFPTNGEVREDNVDFVFPESVELREDYSIELRE